MLTEHFVLHLKLSDPYSQFSFTLCPVVVRLGQRLGLRGRDDPSISVFENEMRIRLWWQIVSLDVQIASRHPGVEYNIGKAGFNNVRLPLNVNDADLFPEMAEPPAEHSRTTEMIYCLIKYEASIVIRRSEPMVGVKHNFAEWMGPNLPLATKDKWINELESAIEGKYLQYCDPKIPMHHLAILAARLGMCRFRLRSHHPRNNPNWSSPEETNLLFETSVRLLGYDNALRRTNYPHYLMRPAASRTKLDALICVLTELRRRTKGDLVETAWHEVEILFNDDYDLLVDTDNSLYLSIGDLALKAWETRMGTIEDPQAKPLYISSLQNARITGRKTPPNCPINPATEKAPDKAQAPAGSMYPVDHHATVATELLSETNLHSLDWTFWDGLLEEFELEDHHQQTLGYDFG